MDPVKRSKLSHYVCLHMSGNYDEYEQESRVYFEERGQEDQNLRHNGSIIPN